MTAAEYLALACPHHTTRPPARVDCQLCFFDAATELLALRAERDSLKLRVQQLEADEDRLDWLNTMVSRDVLDHLLYEAQHCIGVRTTIDRLRGEERL